MTTTVPHSSSRSVQAVRAGARHDPQRQPHGIVRFRVVRGAGAPDPLEPKTKSAHLVEASLTEPAGQHVDFVAQFRALLETRGTARGPTDRQRQGKGFKVVSEADDVALATLKRRCRCCRDGDPLIEGATMVLSEIRFDDKLDEKLFSLEGPEGYTLNERKISVTLDLEANVINLLRAYADVTGGSFPEKLDDWARTGKSFAPRTSSGRRDGAALSGAGAITAILSTSKPARITPTPERREAGREGHDHLLASGQGEGTYRAIYADLTVRTLRPTKSRGRNERAAQQPSHPSAVPRPRTFFVLMHEIRNA